MLLDPGRWAHFSESIQSKARRLVARGHVTTADGRSFRVAPLPGKGKTTHVVTRGGCTCQGYAVKSYCSHFVAVEMFFALKEE